LKAIHGQGKRYQAKGSKQALAVSFKGKVVKGRDFSAKRCAAFSFQTAAEKPCRLLAAVILCANCCVLCSYLSLLKHLQLVVIFYYRRFSLQFSPFVYFLNHKVSVEI